MSLRSDKIENTMVSMIVTTLFTLINFENFSVIIYTPPNSHVPFY